MKIYTDIYDRFIRAELDKKDNFKPGSLRTSSIEFDNEGIFAIVGSMESDPVNTTVHSFLFQKTKFTLEQVKKWLIDNKGIVYEEEILNLQKNNNIKNAIVNKKIIIEDQLGLLNIQDKHESEGEDMPVMKGKDKIGSFARWGESGKKYYFDPDNEDSKTRAEGKAKGQGKAIESNEVDSKSFNLNDMNLNRTLFLFDQFHQESSEKLVKEILTLDKDGSEDINILINSFGGYTNALTAILDTLNGTRSKVNTICLGEADSCGAVLLASGTDRFIGKQSRAMIHEVGTMAFGKVSQIQKELEDATAVNELIVDILSAKSDQDRDILANIIKEDTFLSAQESVDFGLVDGLLSGEEEFLTENNLASIKINAANLDSFIFNNIKNAKIKKEKTEDSKGESQVDVKDTEDKTKNVISEPVPEAVVEEAAVVEAEVVDEPVVSKNETLLNELLQFAKEPAKLINHLDALKSINEENAQKLKEFQDKENTRKQSELKGFVDNLVKENKVLPAELGLLQPVFNSLNDTKELEFHYSKYGVKESDTALGIFKKFLNNLPNRGLLGQISEISEDYDYDVAVNHFSQKLYSKSKDKLNSSEFKNVLDTMKRDPKASKLI